MQTTDALVARRAPRTLRRLGLALAGAACLLLLAAAPSLAAPAWRVTSMHGPQNMPPGGIGQYVIQLYNVGDTDSTSTYTVTDALPAGFIASSASGSGWSCSGLGTGTVRCSSSSTVPAPGSSVYFSGGERGGAQRLTLTVLASGTTGSGENVVTVSGGGAAAASASDPTVVSATPAGFGFVPGSFLADAFDGSSDAAAPVRQAGSHPYELRVDFRTNLTVKTDPDDASVGFLRYTTPEEHLKDLVTKLPAGLIGNPRATPRCPAELLYAPGVNSSGSCPPDTQVGTLDLVLNNGKTIPPVDSFADIPVYNMEPPDGTVAAFAFSYLSNPGWIIVTLDPSDHYAVVATITDTIEVLPVRSASLTLWGVPADPSHDALRVDAEDPNGGATAYGTPSHAPIKPLLTMPSTCGVPGALQMKMSSWQHPDAFTPWATSTPATMRGCDDPRFAEDPGVTGRFDPSISVRPAQTTTSTPTALDVDLFVPQKDDTVANASDLYADSGAEAAIATPPLRNATVTLPPGMTVSPSSADGLAACSPLQVELGTNDAPTCPDASKLGTVTIDTPLLDGPLRGDVFLATQDDNPFGTTLAIYLVASGPGVIVKLPGKVEPDPLTGQLTTTFDDNPPIPFSHMNVHFAGGPRASLVTPPTCGMKTATADLTAWNLQLPTVHASSAFAIDGNCAKGFDPGFAAGTREPVAGKDSPLVTRFTRGDNDDELSRIDVALPPGLLGRIADVPLCGAADARGGTCPAASLIGRATVGAGPGPHPFYITDGRVYMTGPYGGAPFGLSIVVHAKAGPLDLGDVVVQAQVQVDRTTAALRVVSDPLPTILAGIPLQIRVVDVTVDRAGFTFNPTNCAELGASATLTSTGGRTSTKHARFEVDGCRALPFKPRFAIRVGKRGRTRTGASTPLTATVGMTPGQANLRAVTVSLPTTLNARLPVVYRACTPQEFATGHCAKAKAGTAVAVTPLLRDPLRGGVYFVRNGRPLPDLMVALRGQVDVDLTGRVTIVDSKHLRTSFDTVPDVPIRSFTLRLVAGRHGPIGVARNLCTTRGRTAKMRVVLNAQNGKVVRRAQRLKVVGCPQAHKHRPTHRRSR